MDDGWASASAVLQRFPFKAIKLNRSELSETAIKTILFYVLHSNTAHYMPKGKGSLFFFFIITKEYVHSISSLTSPCDSMVWKSDNGLWFLRFPILGDKEDPSVVFQTCKGTKEAVVSSWEGLSGDIFWMPQVEKRHRTLKNGRTFCRWMILWNIRAIVLLPMTWRCAKNRSVIFIYF